MRIAKIVMWELLGIKELENAALLIYLTNR